MLVVHHQSYPVESAEFIQMAKIIAVTNQKGGVGKTTTSVNLAASLGANRHRVLLVDLDPQGNATMGSGVDKNHLEKGSSYEVIMGNVHLSKAVVPLSEAGYVLLPANGNLTAAEVELLDAKMREQRLRLALAQVKDKYDFILVDCPPSLSMLTVNALVAAHAALIPIQCEYYALEGLTSLISTIDKIRSRLNPQLRIAGLLRTMFDPRNNLANEVSAQLVTHFRDQLYTTIIPRNVRLAEAPSHGQPVLLYDRASRGALSYMALASEVARREANYPMS